MLNNHSNDLSTSDSLVQQYLLDPYHINAQHLQSVLDQSMRHGSDYADLFLQYRESEVWQMEQSQMRHGSYDQDAGFGLRVINGTRTGFAYSDGCDAVQLKKALAATTQMSALGQDRSIAMAPNALVKPTTLYALHNPLLGFSVEAKERCLAAIDKAIRDLDDAVCNVSCSLSADYEVVLILNHEGRWVTDVRPLTSLHVRAVLMKNGRRATGRFALGGRCDYATLLADMDADVMAKKVLHQAHMNLQAAPPPGGVMPVVLGPGWPAVLLHEAIGHGLEGDHIRKEASVFARAKGTQVANEQCTIVDDATIAGARGSLQVDDEGCVGQRTTLIENGIVTGFMQDHHNASLMGERSSGNARRECYASRPLVRMTNTFMLPGHHSPEDIIGSVKDGIYCVDFAGGEVDITSGQFVFSTSEAYRIENGKITTPISATTLVGDGLSVLKQVSMVGNDLSIDNGQGVCGKDGQSVPVGVGQPTLRVDGLMVGGVG